MEWVKKFLCVNVDAVEPVYPQASKLTSLKSLSLDSLLNQTYFWSNFWSWPKDICLLPFPNCFYAFDIFCHGFHWRTFITFNSFCLLCNGILWFTSCITVLCSLLFLHFPKVGVTSLNLTCVLVLVFQILWQPRNIIVYIVIISSESVINITLLLKMILEADMVNLAWTVLSLCFFVWAGFVSSHFW